MCGAASDLDWNNQEEGKSQTIPTCAAITARSWRSGGVNASLMDGSVRWFADGINLGVWQAYATRADGEIIPTTE